MQYKKTTKNMNKNELNSQKSTSDEVDLREVIGRLLDRKLLILIITISAAVIGAIYAKSMPNVYRAEAVLQVESKEGGLPGLSGLQGFLVEGSEAVTEIEILKSRMILGDVVEKLNLSIIAKPNVFPLYSGVFQGYKGELKPSLVEGYAWGGEKIKVTQFDVPEGYLDKSFTLVALGKGRYELRFGEVTVLSGFEGQLSSKNGFKVFVQELVSNPKTEFHLVKVTKLRRVHQIASGLNVKEKSKKSGILSVGYESIYPEEAEKLLKSITETYVRKNINRNSAEANKSLTFLEERLPEIEIKLNNAEDRLNAFQVSAESINILSETESLLEQMVGIEEKISKLQLEEIDIQRRFKPTHPAYRAFISRMDELNKRKEGFHKQIRDLPKTQQKLLRLKRDVEVNTQIYTQILNSIQELNIMRAGTVGNVRIIDDAKANNYQPVKPKKSLIVMVSTILGFMFAVIIVLIRAAMKRGVENPMEIESIGLSVLAAIPFSDLQTKLLKKAGFSKGVKHRGLLAVESPSDIAVEAVRSIRTAVQLSMLDAENNRVMVTGPSPSVGKTFTSANLAVTFAEAGKKVIVVDADLRKGTLNLYFQLERNKGLSDFLSSSIEYKESIQSTGVDNLDVMVSGVFPSNPSELLVSPKFSNLMEALSEDYDVVIIDSPPVLAVTDALVVGQLMGTNLLVCRYGQNPVKEIELAATRLIRSQVEIEGVVFNGMNKSSHGYGYGYYAYDYKDNEKN